MKKVGASSYELKIPKMWRNLHPVVKTEVIYLLCLRSRMIYNDYHTRQPKCNTGQEVEQILNSRWWRGFRKPSIPCKMARTAIRRSYLGSSTKVKSMLHSFLETHRRLPTIRILGSLQRYRKGVILGGGNDILHLHQYDNMTWSRSSNDSPVGLPVWYI